MHVAWLCLLICFHILCWIFRTLSSIPLGTEVPWGVVDGKPEGDEDDPGLPLDSPPYPTHTNISCQPPNLTLTMLHGTTTHMLTPLGIVTHVNHITDI